MNKKIDLRLTSLLAIVLLLNTFVIPLNNQKSIRHADKSSPQKQARSIIENCKNNTDKSYCYEEKFIDTAKKTDFLNILQVLHEGQKLNVRLNFCHSIAHKISLQMVKKHPENQLNHLKLISADECSSGFLHGTIEGLYANDPHFSLDAKNIKTLCSNVSEHVKQDGFNRGYASQIICAHSIGHIILVEKNANTDEAISSCPILSNEFALACYKGVFMEYFTRENLVNHGIAQPLFIDDQQIINLERLCNNNLTLAFEACWETISRVFRIKGDNNYQIVYNLCQHAPLKNQKMACYLAAAGEIFSQYGRNANDFSQSGELCSPFSNNAEYYHQCIEIIIRQNTPNNSQNSFALFCKSVLDSYNEYCYEKLRTLSHKTQKQTLSR